MPPEEYKEVTLNGNMPKTLRYAMIFIDRVGFPIMAFILMFAMCYISLEKVTVAIKENTVALVERQTSAQEFQSGVLKDHQIMMQRIEKVHDKIT